MDVTQIPFVRHIGISKKDNHTLKIEATEVLQNHMQTIHASAQFALAETQSGLYLQTLFPEYLGEVVPLLRSSSVKYKSPAILSISAYASVDDEIKNKFISLFERKGRGTIAVHIELRDENGTITMIGEFSWFIQMA